VLAFATQHYKEYEIGVSKNMVCLKNILAQKDNLCKAQMSIANATYVYGHLQTNISNFVCYTDKTLSINVNTSNTKNYFIELLDMYFHNMSNSDEIDSFKNCFNYNEGVVNESDYNFSKGT
jgi:hypothetical protein